MSDKLFTIALEEHFAIPAILSRTALIAGPVSSNAAMELLVDLGDKRIAAMDSIGVDVQVISHTAPGLEHVLDADAQALAREANDTLLDAVARYPQRFAGFATLAVSDPAAAAEELTRTVGLGMRGALLNGSIDGRFLDHPCFDDLLGTAESLGVPLYVHPGLPPAAVIEAYYAGFAPEVGRMFVNSAWGWHADTAVHILRMVLGGVFNRHPDLQIIIGHMGEMLPVMLDRADGLLSPFAGLQKSVAEYLTQNVHLTIAGVYSMPAFQAAVQTFGIDRIMFSTDFPYVPGPPAQAFLKNAALGPADRARLASGNAAKLLGIEIPS